MLSAAARSSSIRSPLSPSSMETSTRSPATFSTRMSRSWARWPSLRDRVDLAGLGVDQERLEQLAVALEQGVGQRAVPRTPLPVQVDQQAGDGVEQPLAVLDQLAGKTQEQPPELPGMLQVLGDQDGVAGVGLVDQADRRTSRELADLQVAQDPVLLVGDPAGQLLEGVQDVVGLHEADQGGWARR